MKALLILGAVALASVATPVASGSLPMTPARLHLLLPTSEPVMPAAVAIAYDDQRTNGQYPLVHQVRCPKSSGTAFRVGPTRFLTAGHVVAHPGCLIDGNPVTVVEDDKPNDFAILDSGPPRIDALRVNCGGYNTSEWYWSAGYAFGLGYQTTVALYSTAFNDESGKRLFIGKHTVIPGMSGGPVMNAAGEVVGVVNAYNPLFGISFSRALKDTALCRS